MIVKLTYSAELDEVPSEVASMVDKTSQDLEELLEDLRFVSESLHKTEPDVASSLSKIKFAMRFVEKLDTRLKDCDSILSGYSNVIEQQEQKNQSPVQEVSTDPQDENKEKVAKKKAG